MSLPAPGTVLCEAAAVAEGAGRGFVFGAGRERVELFVVRWQGALRGYLNRCPHAGTPLDWRPDAFFAPDRRHLMCATHGALFRPEDGACVAGPPCGRALTPVAVEQAEGQVRLA